MNILNFFTCCFKPYEELEGDLILEDQIPDSKKLNPMTELPPEVILYVFSYLSSHDLPNCCLVSKEWRQLAIDVSLQPLWSDLIKERLAFGKKKWKKYVGKIGEEPPLPLDIYTILTSEKKVAKSRLLVLIPETVNEEALTLNSFNKLIVDPKKDNKASVFFSEDVLKEHGDKLPEKSYWVLMTNDCVYKSPVGYQLPKIREATICIFMEYIHSGKKLFRMDWRSLGFSTYTECQEKIRKNQPVIVGGFAQKLNVIDKFETHIGGSDFIGTAALKRL